MAKLPPVTVKISSMVSVSAYARAVPLFGLHQTRRRALSRRVAGFLSLAKGIWLGNVRGRSTEQLKTMRIPDWDSEAGVQLPRPLRSLTKEPRIYIPDSRRTCAVSF